MPGLEDLTVIARGLSAGGSVLALGGALFLALFGGMAQAGDPMARRQIRLAAGAGLAGVLAEGALRVAMLGGLQGFLDPALAAMALLGGAGLAAATRAAGLLMLLAALHRGFPERRALAPLAAGGGLLVLASFAATGHVGLAGPGAAMRGVLALHGLAVAFWVGALAPLAAALAGPSGPAAAVLLRFGRLAPPFLFVLLASGMLMAWRVAGPELPPQPTPYVFTLGAKITLVVAMLALGAVNRFALVPALARRGREAAAPLARSIRVEGGLAALVLLLTALLAVRLAP